MGSLTEIFRDKQEWGWAGRPDRTPSKTVPPPSADDELFFPWNTAFPPTATDAATGTTRDSGGERIEYLSLILGRDRDFETEHEAAKARERSERELFLSAVEGAKRI